MGIEVRENGARVRGFGDGELRRVRTLSIEVAEPLPEIDLSAADEWQVVVTHEGVAMGRFTLASPGRLDHPALVEATLGRHAARARAQSELRRRLRRRLGSPPLPRADLPCSVVVCTHRRPDLLAEALASLQDLDPPPLEVIVVDNDPGAADCRAEVEAAGGRYVREDRRGLNLARVTGFRRARGQLVAFTDDDCRVPRNWLRALPEHFADPTVAAVTGPGFPAELETIYQYQREQVAGFPSSLQLSRYDWTNVWAVHSGRVGAGANMVLRRGAVAAADLFPPELDVGTRTRSGGDLYALYRVLAAGHRVIYDPSAYFLHQHGRDLSALLATVEGYGIGFSSFLTKALVEHREPATFAVWRWLWGSYVEAVLDLISEQGDQAILDLRRRYLIAGLRGPIAWPRARREALRAPASVRSRAADPAAAAPPAKVAAPAGTRRAERARPRDAPAVSVLLACADRERPLACLAGLESQDAELAWEVVIAAPDGDRAGSEEGATIPIRQVRSEPGPAAINAAASLARGELLLIVDAALRPGPGLLAAHVERHRAHDGEAVVIGPAPARPRARSLAASAIRLGSEDRHRFVREAAARTFVDFAATNVSMPRTLFERVGPFNPAYGIRAGCEWGARALDAGVRAVYAAEAEAHREPVADTREYVERAREAGRADRLLVGAWPETSATVRRRPLAMSAPGRAAETAAVLALSLGPLRRAAIAALPALEAIKLRRAWYRLAQLARGGAHRHGFGVLGPRAWWVARPATQVVELDSDLPIPPPRVAAPRVDLRWRGRALRVVLPPGGHWHHAMFDRGLAAVDPEELGPPDPAPASAPVDLSGAEVILGPARGGGDDVGRPAIEATGARVRLVGHSEDGTGPGAHWAAIDRAVRTSTAEVIAIPLPGARISARWLGHVAAALAGDRVGALSGAGLPLNRQPRPVQLRSRHAARVPLDPGGAPAQFLAVRRRELERIGGLDPQLAAVGMQAPVIDVLDRMLVADMVIGYCEVPGLSPPGALRRHAHRGRLRRAYARGGLVVLRAARLGGWQGAGWFIGVGLVARTRMLYRALVPSIRRVSPGGPPTVSGWLVGSSAYFAGMIAGLVSLLRQRSTRLPRLFRRE